MVIMASARGNTVRAIACLVQGDEGAVREVIHRFNERGPACLDPRGMRYGAVAATAKLGVAAVGDDMKAVAEVAPRPDVLPTE
jgi:hypothetical protein